MYLGVALYIICDIIVLSKEIFVINSKRKGKVGELEVANLLKDKGLNASGGIPNASYYWQPSYRPSIQK